MLRSVKVFWDPPKRESNFDKHGLDFAAIDETFFVTATITAAKQGRRKAIGWLGPAIVSVIFRPLGDEGLAIISARLASDRERRLVK
jgi:uncharacterized protein